MKFGCSECLCVAIEAHQSDLLTALVQRADVVYRDIFWAPCPSKWVRELHNTRLWISKRIPQLHHLKAHDSDLSFVGRDDCGHMQVDVEIQTPFEVVNRSNPYILVSLPMMARWHSSKTFDAEGILKRSGKFDYSEPQFFHVRNPELYGFPRPVIPGPLLNDGFTFLACEFESDSEPLTVPLNSTVLPTALHLPTSSLPALSESTFVRCYFSEPHLHFYKCYAKLTRFLIDLNSYIGGYVYPFRVSQMKLGHKKHLEKIFESGADINRLMPVKSVSFSVGLNKKTIINWRNVICLDLFHLNDIRGRSGAFLYVRHIELHSTLKFLLHHGLSFFHGNPIGSYNKPDGESLLRTFFGSYPYSNRSLPAARAIALQLLALGYGRLEVHTAGVRPRDESLIDTRRHMASLQLSHAEAARELEAIVEHFDSGPLTLQQLSRIAVRRAVGGGDFARRVREVILPPTVLNYVAEASEHMPSDEELRQFDIV